ncbi:MAG: transposase [Neisseriaceae bacterium]|nr:transposase [Neisseriaceae bacterium]
MTHLTLNELLALGVSSFPATRQGLALLAERTTWAFIERPSAGRNGKTRLYVVERLPEPYRSLIQAALIEKQVAEHGVNTQGSGCLKDDGVMGGRGIATSATHSRHDGKRGEIATHTTTPAVSAVGWQAHPTADGVAVRGALGVKKLPFARLLEKPQGAGCLKVGVGGQEIATHKPLRFAQGDTVVSGQTANNCLSARNDGKGGGIATPALPSRNDGNGDSRQEMSVAVYGRAMLALSDAQRAVADARLTLVRCVLRIADAQGISAKAACGWLCEQLGIRNEQLGIGNGILRYAQNDELVSGCLKGDGLSTPCGVAVGRNAHPTADSIAMTEMEWQKVVQAAEMANARKNGDRTLSVASLMRWVKVLRESASMSEFMVKLSPKPPKAETPLDGLPWLGAFLSFYRKPNKPTVVMAYEAFSRWWLEEHNGDSANMPSLATVCRVVKRLPEIVKQVGRKTGSELRQVMPYVKRDWSVLKPNDVWIGDGHSFKARVAHPVHGNPFKPEVTMIIDGATRLIVGWAVSLAENTLAVADAIRYGVHVWGCPAIYYSDNGAGQTAKALDDPKLGILERLGVTHHTGIAGNPQGRGIIERLWQETLIPLAKQYATYLGADADQRTLQKHYRELNSAAKAWNSGKELTVKQAKRRNEMPSFKQFLADIEQCVAKYNTDHRHSSLPKNGHGQHWTPFGFYKRRCEETGFEPDYVPELELNSLFMPQVERTVSRCVVRWLDNEYFSLALAEYHGEKVVIRYDLHKAEQVQVWDMNGKFICLADFEGNRRHAFPVSAVENAERKRLERRVKHLDEQKALAEAELKPAIEQKADFSLLVENGVEERLPETVEYRFL